MSKHYTGALRRLKGLYPVNLLTVTVSAETTHRRAEAAHRCAEGAHRCAEGVHCCAETSHSCAEAAHGRAETAGESAETSGKGAENAGKGATTLTTALDSRSNLARQVSPLAGLCLGLARPVPRLAPWATDLSPLCGWLRLARPNADGTSALPG